MASHLVGLAQDKGVHRVIVAMPDRRGTLPVEELLNMRLAGVKVEEATSWLEKITGRIEVEQLYPSWLIFAEGFRFSGFFRMVRRALNFAAGPDWSGGLRCRCYLHCAGGEIGFAGSGAVSAEARGPGRFDILLLQIPHHATGCGSRHGRDLGHG